jgi:hypothetical protein
MFLLIEAKSRQNVEIVVDYVVTDKDVFPLWISRSVVRKPAADPRKKGET